MSVRVSAWAWELECASSGEKLVLLALADHAGDDGTCIPSTGRLSEKTGIGNSTVRKHLDALEERGVLSRRRRRRKDGKLGGYTYRLNWDGLDTSADGSAVADEDPATADGAAMDHRRSMSAPAPMGERSTADGAARGTITEPSMNRERANGSQARRPETSAAASSTVLDELMAGYVDDYRIVHGDLDPPAGVLGPIRSATKRELRAGARQDHLAMVLGVCARENRTAVAHVLADVQAQLAQPVGAQR